MTTLLPMRPERFAPYLEAAVGSLWVHIERKHGTVSAYVYDLEVEPAFRRQGHAERALQVLEALAATAGAKGRVPYFDEACPPTGLAEVNADKESSRGTHDPVAHREAA